MRKNQSTFTKGLAISLPVLVLVLVLISLTGCQTLEQFSSKSKPVLTLDRKELLGKIFALSTRINANETAFEFKMTTESRFFSNDNVASGNCAYLYDQTGHLKAAHTSTIDNNVQEEFIWLPSNAFLRRAEMGWEQVSSFPNQSYALRNVCDVFAKIESQCRLLKVEGQPDLAEFYYDSDNKANLNILAGIGNINLQQLPLNGLRAIAHFFVNVNTGVFQQVNLQVINGPTAKELVALELIFTNTNQPLDIKAPIDANSEVSADQGEFNDEPRRYEILQKGLAEHYNHQTYNLVTDLKYLYNVSGMNLKGHTVNHGQVVYQPDTYFFRGDRRIQNDRTDMETEFVTTPNGDFILMNNNWQRATNAAPNKDLMALVFNDLLSLNQGLVSKTSAMQTTFSYVGNNQLFFLLCEDLFKIDLTDFRGQDINIDLQVKFNNQSQQIEKLQIRLQSAHNANLDLQGYLEFFDFDGPVLVDLPDNLNATESSDNSANTDGNTMAGN